MENALTKLFAHAKRYQCPKGQILVSPDQEPRGVILIHQGYVKTYDIDLRGENQLVAISAPGEIIPLFWAIDEEPGQLFYQAMTELEFSLIRRAEFRRALDQDVELLKIIVKYLLRSSKFSQQRIQNLEYKTAQERIAFRLLFLSTYFGLRQAGAVRIVLPITYQDIADSTNMTRDTANRVMRQLTKDGIIKRSDHRIDIVAPEKLQDIIGTETTLNN